MWTKHIAGNPQTSSKCVPYRHQPPVNELRGPGAAAHDMGGICDWYTPELGVTSMPDHHFSTWVPYSVPR